MARSKSVILSAAEKKTALSNLKAEIKAAKQGFKDIIVSRKVANKSFASVAKAHEAVLKGFDKSEVAAAKDVTKLESQLAALTA